MLCLSHCLCEGRHLDVTTPRGWLDESNLMVLLLKSRYALIGADLGSYEGPYDKASRPQEVKSSTKHVIVMLLRLEKAPVRGDSSGSHDQPACCEEDSLRKMKISLTVLNTQKRSAFVLGQTRTCLPKSLIFPK